MTRRALPALITLGLVVITALVLLWMGREPICKCGYVKLWHGETFSSENSQHLSDWYTPSHLLHGFIFYGVAWLLLRRIALGWRLVIATVVATSLNHWNHVGRHHRPPYKLKIHFMLYFRFSKLKRYHEKICDTYYSHLSVSYEFFK